MEVEEIRKTSKICPSITYQPNVEYEYNSPTRFVLDSSLSEVKDSLVIPENHSPSHSLADSQNETFISNEQNSISQTHATSAPQSFDAQNTVILNNKSPTQEDIIETKAKNTHSPTHLIDSPNNKSLMNDEIDKLQRCKKIEILKIEENKYVQHIGI